MSDRRPTNSEVEFLDGIEARPSSIEELGHSTVGHEPNFGPLWVIAALLGAVALVAIASAIFTGDDANEEADLAASTPTTGLDNAGLENAGLENAGNTTDPDPVGDTPARILGSFGLAAGEALPDSVVAPAIDPGVVLIGHGPSRRLARVDSTGRVSELLATDGPRYVPLARNETSVVGFQTFTGDHLVITAEGTAHTVDVDLTDAPTFTPRNRTEGFVMHATATGQLSVLDRFGAEEVLGVVLASGASIVGDTDIGVVVAMPDGTALVIDPVAGTVIERRTNVPLAAAGDTHVERVCDGPTSCRAVIVGLFRGISTPLPIESERLSRLLAGLSPGGSIVLVRARGSLGVITTVDGRTIDSIDNFGPAEISWLDDTSFVAHVETGDAVMWTMAEQTAFDLRPVIDPSFRGLTLLRMPS
jgi:hypothetical protein